MKQTNTLLEIKDKDIFRASYTEEYREKKKGWDLRHCFDGILVAKKITNGSILLVDTFWGGADDKCFTPEEAQEIFNLRFVANLNDLQEADPKAENYYDDKDVVVLNIHHGYRTQIYLREGAVKSKEKMVSVCKKKIEEQESTIKFAKDRIEWLKRDMEHIEQGELDKVHL